MSPRGSGRPRLLAGVALATLAAPVAASAQVVVRDLVITGGVSAEGYQGNLAAVTVPVVDSTDQAAAAVGEFGARGDLLVVNGATRSISVAFDAGLRQFAAAGFELRDYAPREWVGTVGLAYRQALGDVASMSLAGRLRGRSVEDRPPMPLFLQPGYGAASGSIRLQLREIEGVRFDAQVAGEYVDYGGLDLVPQLDLLDRRVGGLEVGAAWGRDWTVRFRSAYRRYHYPRQGSFDPDDPFRRDRTVEVGAAWTLESSVFAQVGVDGTINRSNSNRPEYDAVSLHGSLSAPLPGEFGLNLYGVLTRKSYLRDSDVARLVPGEEADNASLLYASLARPLAPNLDGALRFGWTRAETDIGDAYFQRYGLTFLLHYRPLRPR